MSDVMRTTYRELTAREAQNLRAIKQAGTVLYDIVDQTVVDERSKALAKTNIEQAVMWAVKGITG